MSTNQLDGSHASMAFLARLNRKIEPLLAGFVATLMALMTFCVLWQVTSRLISKAALAWGVVSPIEPSRWTEELASFLLLWLAMFGAAYALRRGEHIGLDSLYVHFINAHQNLLNQLVKLLVIAFLLILIVGGSSLVALTFEFDQRTAGLGWPMALVYVALPASGVLMMLFALEYVYPPEASAGADELAASHAKNNPGGLT